VQRHGLQSQASPQAQAAAFAGESAAGAAWQPQLQAWVQPWQPQAVFRSFMCALLV
jgi:hypothetical protein